MRHGQDQRAIESTFTGSGEACGVARAVDWDASPMGPVHRWPDVLRTAVRLALPSPTPMAIWAGPEFTLIHNDAYGVILGSKRTWAMGRPAREVWAEVWGSLEGEFVEVARGGRAVRHENTPYRLQRHGREEEAYFTFTLSPIRGDGGDVLAILNQCEEVTPAVTALSASEQRYRSVLEAMDEGFNIVEVVLDAAGRPADYVILEANRAHGRLTGLHGVIGKSIRELLPAIEPVWIERIGQVALTGEPARFEEYAAPVSRWFDVHASRLGGPESRRVALVFAETTARKEAELARRESEARLAAVLEQLPVAAGLVDLDGRLVLGNPALRRLLGGGRLPSRDPARSSRWSAEDGEGRPLPPDRWPGARALRGEAVAPGIEFRYTEDDGSVRWTQVAAVPLRDGAGRITGAVVVAQDVTAQKLAAAELRVADQRKTEFLGVLSHELRNPLAPIRNGIYLLERVPPGSEQARRSLEVLRRQTEHLARLVNDLLDVTRISRGKIELVRERLELREVARRTADDLRSQFEQAGVALGVELGADPVPVDGDPTRLSQVLANLLQNAAKFTPRGGAVTVAVSAAGGQAVVSVRDTGEGIAPDELGRVFEPFAQGVQDRARSKGGLGLGLSLVKGLVELHGGSVRAASDGAGRGAEFVVSLPLASPAPERAPEPAPAPGRSRTVLVVEDNADAAQTLADLLALAGHRVSVARDVPSGLALARELRPDAIVCDIGLPGQDGYELARQVRRDLRLAATRLVALTGYAQPEDRARALAAGFDAHLSKPPPVDLLQRLLADD